MAKEKDPSKYKPVYHTDIDDEAVYGSDIFDFTQVNEFNPLGVMSDKQIEEFFKQKEEPVDLNSILAKEPVVPEQEQPFYDKVYEQDIQNIKNARIANGLITGMNIARNIPQLFNKSNAEPLSAPHLTTPQTQSNVMSQMNQMQATQGQYNAQIRNLEELGIGDPNVLLAGYGQSEKNELEQRGKIMAEENQRLTQQSVMDAETANKQAEINANVELMNKQRQQQDNMMRSQEKTNAMNNIMNAIAAQGQSNIQTNQKLTQSEILKQTLIGMGSNQNYAASTAMLNYLTGKELYTIPKKNSVNIDDLTEQQRQDVINSENNINP